jgi:hypothetical protein
MSIPPPKRPPIAGASAASKEPPPEPRNPDRPDASDASNVPAPADSDPAGRLLHHLRDRGERAEREREGTSAPAFVPGSRVRVLRGTFSGKSGLVQELDGRGGARVQLGTLSARIDLVDLVAEAEPGAPRERLTLSSSHRKPR